VTFLQILVPLFWVWD